LETGLLDKGYTGKRARKDSPLPLWSRPGYLVRRLHQIHTALFLEECGEFAITPVQYGVMTALQDHPGSDQVSLAAEVGIDHTNVADVLERLAERGLVRRERSEHDRRSMSAFLTDDGDALLARTYLGMQRAQERFLEPLAPEFRAAFVAMMTQLVEGNNHAGPRARPEGRQTGKTSELSTMSVS
jgi:DNA-binding MarR family transcriptional regulator